jgi:hypothetical protein
MGRIFHGGLSIVRLTNILQYVFRSVARASCVWRKKLKPASYWSLSFPSDCLSHRRPQRGAAATKSSSSFVVVLVLESLFSWVRELPEIRSAQRAPANPCTPSRRRQKPRAINRFNRVVTKRARRQIEQELTEETEDNLTRFLAGGCKSILPLLSPFPPVKPLCLSVLCGLLSER